MNIMSQQKQTKPVVEHKGVYPIVGASAGFLVLTQSLTWDTLCAVGSQISLVGVLLQSIQQLAWDTLSHLEISDEIAGILNNFLVCRCGPAGWAPFAKYFANSAEIPFADSRRLAVQKKLVPMRLPGGLQVRGLK